MSLHKELRSAQRSLDELARCVARLEQLVGDDLEVRRVRSDTVHLQESLALLTAAQPAPRDAPPAEAAAAGRSARPELIAIPDTPYDHRLWTDADDEGVGVRDRHCP